MAPRENKNNAYANFVGTNKEYYGIFKSGLLLVLNAKSWIEHEKHATMFFPRKNLAVAVLSCPGKLTKEESTLEGPWETLQYYKFL